MQKGKMKNKRNTSNEENNTTITREISRSCDHNSNKSNRKKELKLVFYSKSYS